MEDSKIIDLYWQRDEQAVSETKRIYGSYCFTVARSILNDPWDAEEVVADTWVHAWNSIPPRRPRFLKSFLAKITRNLALDMWRAQNSEKRGKDRVELSMEELGECIPSAMTTEGYWAGEELKRTISDFLRKQPLRERNVFLRRYFYFEEVEEIAQRYHLTEANVFQILSRMRRKLKKHLTKEGYDL